jgi:hypothetical protein
LRNRAHRGTGDFLQPQRLRQPVITRHDGDDRNAQVLSASNTNRISQRPAGRNNRPATAARLAERPQITGQRSESSAVNAYAHRHPRHPRHEIMHGSTPAPRGLDSPGPRRASSPRCRATRADQQRRQRPNSRTTA